MSDLLIFSGRVRRNTKVVKTDITVSSDGKNERRTMVHYKIDFDGQTLYINRGFGRKLLEGETYTCILDEKEILIARDAKNRLLGTKGPQIKFWILIPFVGIVNYFLIPIVLSDPDRKKLYGLLIFDCLSLILLILTFIQCRKIWKAIKVLR